MRSVQQLIDAIIDHVGDSIGAIMVTVIVGVLFVDQQAATLVQYSTELMLIFSTTIAVQIIAPLLIRNRRHRRLYVLGFAHLAWVFLVLLSGATDSFTVLISLGLIVATSLWLPYVYTIISALIMTGLYIFMTGGEAFSEVFIVASYAITAAYLVERKISMDLKRKRDTHELAEANVERQRLQSLINSMADGVIATNENGKVLLYNGSALDLLNVNASLEHQQLNDYMNLIDENKKPVDLFKKAARAKAYFVTRDLKLQLDNGETTSLYVSIAPVRISYGTSGEQGYVILLRDITKEKSLEEERDEFISVVSHELRTPVTIAEGNISNAKLLIDKKKDIDSDISDSVDNAHQQVVFLADLINDLSTLSRAERGKLQVEPETIDTVELAKTLVKDYTYDAEQKGLALKMDIDEKAATIISSRLYVREILQNFITNSIKYTKEGSVTLRLRSDPAGSAVFEVEDTGIGISKSDQKKLFEKFFRSEDYRTRQSSGTGLGLYVTLKLAKLINATIDVQSKLNEGSLFRITVPSLETKPQK